MFKHSTAIIVIAFLVLLVAFFDLSNFDAICYKFICSALGIFFRTTCPEFYDLPFWDVAVAIGTISAAYFAYRAIRQTSMQLDIEQSPYVVMQDRLVMGGPDDRAHVISVKNLGKGPAINITATADPEGEISIIEGSNPHSLDLGSNDSKGNWAVDESQILLGLEKQGRKIKSLSKNIPSETNLSTDKKSEAEISLYIWYKDQSRRTYLTKVKIRNSNGVFKVMENKVEKN